ncbi:hypothetical protein SCP_0303490 [Sparassis crispa]|uniref:(2E,6E)-farnesyl diphosphate synthase n=1 Tax=Sparassis crispa TaxID=139825 RepID=A0A401GEM0_9APHY|nr:hypothetical protein SCP_0303490 [Sparassis crispa]GBE80632.1 hypothetical protein SCP_0303490 [Sparassis crispa]
MASSDSADIIAIIDNVQSLSGKSCHEDTALLEPYTYIQSRPGKGIWERMIQAFDHWLKVPKPQLEIITRIVDLLHTGSLMIDDIEDNSQIRRGGPVAHKVFGIPKTLNAANLAYFMAYRELSSLKEIYSTSGCHDYPYLYKADRRPLSVILDDIVTGTH